MTAAIAAVIPSEPNRARARYLLRISLVAALLGMTLAGCATTDITHQVLTPAPSSPLSTFFIERAQVQSRETGDTAWQRNDDIARRLVEGVRAALTARSKTLMSSPTELLVRTKAYVAYRDASVRTRDSIKGKPHIEIRIEVVEAATQVVRYSTFTVAPIREGLLAGMGVGEQSDELIQNAIDSAAQDFAARL